MLVGEVEKLYPSAKMLVKEKVASRILAKDASLYEFSDEASACAAEYMGWTDLASNPPYPLEDIQSFADDAIARGLKTVVLIGQGGSTQAPMTITKYNKVDSGMVSFKTLDSDSPVRVRGILAEAKPETTLFIISSKSGGTIEPRLALRAVRSELAECIDDEEFVKRLVAITDPGSDLEKQAKEEGWAAVFPGEPTVGGRFSALSVFGLLPAALVGIDLRQLMGHAVAAKMRSTILPSALPRFCTTTTCKGATSSRFLRRSAVACWAYGSSSWLPKASAREARAFFPTSSSMPCCSTRIRAIAPPSCTKPKPTCGTNVRTSR